MRTARRFAWGGIAGLAVALWSASAPAQALVPTFSNVPYGSDPAQVLDVYLAPSSTPTPALIEIHGGGWWQGSKSQFQFYLADAGGTGIIEKAYARGISVISIDYRLVDPSGPVVLNAFPTGNLDVVRAIQFTRANAAQWNIDPDRVGAIGRSAGGHLALWAALSEDFVDPQSADPVERESSRLYAIVNCWSPTDLAPPTGLLCSPNRLQLCWYMGVKDPAQMANVPLSTLQAASPTWLAAHGASPDHQREVPLMNLYNGNPIATSSSQLPSPTDDAHNLLFSFLIKEALEAIGHTDITLIHDWDLMTQQPAVTDAAADFLEDRLGRPLVFLAPEPGSGFNPAAFAPSVRVNLGGTQASQFLADMQASPSTDGLFVAVASNSLFLLLPYPVLQQLDQAGFATLSAAGNELRVDFAPFPLAALGQDPWLAGVVLKGGELFWSIRSY